MAENVYKSFELPQVGVPDRMWGLLRLLNRPQFFPRPRRIQISRDDYRITLWRWIITHLHGLSCSQIFPQDIYIRLKDGYNGSSLSGSSLELPLLGGSFRRRLVMSTESGLSKGSQRLKVPCRGELEGNEHQQRVSSCACLSLVLRSTQSSVK